MDTATLAPPLPSGFTTSAKNTNGDDESHLDTFTDLFTEPPDYYQPEKQPTFTEHTLLDGQTLRLRLVGHNPLWGHFLWNAARVTAHYLEENSDTLLKGKTILELGAGAGLPSLVAVLKGAKKVIVTDYPDPDLLANIQWNITQYFPSSTTIFMEPYTWGHSPTHLLSHLETEKLPKFSVLILSDVIFNHSEHHKLLSSIQQTLFQSPDAVALIFFTPHRPWKYNDDIAFFKLAEEGGFRVEKILEKKMDPMFENDPGDVELRRTVFGYALKWKNL